ncbi:MAG: DUF5777 family beta-barrel protein [Bacteroidota bacterium]
MDILFATQIAPIFASNCIACHKTGGQAPDLTSAASAYANIKSMNLVNTLESVIQHKFGGMGNGKKDLFGIMAPGANVRIALDYVIAKNLLLRPVKPCPQVLRCLYTSGGC